MYDKNGSYTEYLMKTDAERIAEVVKDIIKLLEEQASEADSFGQGGEIHCEYFVEVVSDLLRKKYNA